MKPVVFLDRDGTLIEDVDFLVREDQIRIFQNTIPALRLLREAGFLLIVLSNQSGVARGYLTEERVEELNRLVFNQMRMLGEIPDAFFYCPHHPDVTNPIYGIDCNCRKPKTGLVSLAAQRFELDPKRSYAIGDKLSDVVMAQSLGGMGVLVLSGHGREEQKRLDANIGSFPDYIAIDILEAAQWIVADLRGR